MFTYPCFHSTIISVVIEECVEDNQQGYCCVICLDCLQAAELPIISDIHPGAVDQNSSNAVKHGLHQDKNQVHKCKGALFCPVPK